jgi:F-type H+-transporting ATPase subunit b
MVHAEFSMTRLGLHATALLILLVVGAGAPLAARAPAADEKSLEKLEKSEVKGAKEGIFDFRADLGIWTIIIFVLLLVVLGKYAWGPLLEGLHRRESNIHAALEEAQKARQEAAALQERLQAQMNEAAANAREIIEEARRDALRLAEEERAKTKAEIQTERDRLYRDLNVAKDQALQQMWEQSAQLATLIASKAIHRQISAEDQRSLVDEALQEMQGAVGERHAFTGARA